MNRRDFMQSAALSAASLTIKAQTASGNFQYGKAGKSQIYFEVHGNAKNKPLFLGFPFMASYGEIFGAANAKVKTEMLAGLTDRYRVLLVDYPNIGKTHSPAPAQMSGDRVYTDLMSVADAAGFKNFAYCGFLWGGINGLLLASRSKRVSALICGTWPPLGGPYGDMLKGTLVNVQNPPPHAMVILRDKAQYAQWVTFYDSMKNWPETKELARIKCPRLALYGSKAVSGVANIQLPWAEIIRARRNELEKLGWQINELPDRDAGFMLDATVAVPAIRAFLDKVS